ncbi:non-ribosomal peptide synthetase [Actinopolyspora mortivallis]|uniref:Phenyloxazoline synthase MbtB n=1 Tax=Actinopolyspora mortivallis TaxID=33906 RepID=A0A2T0GY22_ACTMO|nr:non-ribosomal peptide synthetase [Actinopolyspora mortivallis]PRW63997.1 non-ribosomal peptide synthetase [Actinopolyspora mortivallis]
MTSCDRARTSSSTHSTGCGPLGGEERMGETCSETIGSFPTTPVQRSYWLGRSPEQPLGGVGCHMYFEFVSRTAPDPARLSTAYQDLQKRHPMLRAVFPDERQGTISADPVDTLAVYDFSGRTVDSVESELETVRESFARRAPDPTRGPMTALALSLLPGGASRLHVDVDLMVADPPSIRIALDDLVELYEQAEPPPITYDFTRYRNEYGTLEGESASESSVRTRGLLEGLDLAPPQLPMACAPEELSGAEFGRRLLWLSPSRWGRIREKAESVNARPESVLYAAYVHTLARWSESQGFLVNVPVFDRPRVHADIDRVVGDFSRLLAAPVTVSDGSTLRELLEKVNRSERVLNAHRDSLSVQAINDEARRRREPAPVLGAVYTEMHRDLVSERFVRHFGHPQRTGTQTPQVWLDCLVYPSGESMCMAWDAAEDAFRDGVLDGMAECCQKLLTAFADSDWTSAPPESLPARQRARRRRVNATDGPLSGKLLHEAFFESVEADPEATAVVHAGRSLTRSELAEWSLRFAALLGDYGVDHEEPVGIRLEAGPCQIAAVLGVLAAGACYVPVGPDQPSNRLERILDTAGVRFVIGSAPIDRQGTHVGSVEYVPPAEADRFPARTRPLPVSDRSLAYIIFTSGSTGSPKGVEVEHRSAVNSLEDLNRRGDLRVTDRSLWVSALDFDLSVYEIFGPLMAGGSVVVPTADEQRDPEAWLRLMERHRVTVWDSVPALLDMVVSTAEVAAAEGRARSEAWEEGDPLPEGSESPLRWLRVVFTGGDWIPLELPPRLHRLARGCRFLACGGATEGAVYSNCFEVHRIEPDWMSVPYGYPLRNQRYRVVDGQERDCPDWVPGEMWIGGVGVARGYRRDPERTADRFREIGGVRWYRTGDRGRYRDDGALEFLGRLDDQIKLHGYRIELGEIESVLSSHPDVSRAVAVVGNEESAPGLVAFVQPVGDEIDLRGVREHARNWLADYARPSRLFVLLDLPLNANGKVDRPTLADWAAPMSDSVPDEPPRTETERCLAREWNALLDREVTARGQSFFDLGGDSVGITRLAAVIADRFGVRVSLRGIQTTPTLAGMAETIEEALRSRERRSA